METFHLVLILPTPMIKKGICERQRQLIGQPNSGTQLSTIDILHRSDIEIKKMQRMGTSKSFKVCVFKVYRKKPEVGVYSRELKLVCVVEKIMHATMVQKEKEFFNDE